MIKIIKTVKGVDYEMNFNDSDKERLDALVKKSPNVFRYVENKKVIENNIFEESEQKEEQEISEKRKYTKRSF